MGNNIVVIAEHADGQVKPVTYELISFAKKLQRTSRSNPIRVLLLADEVDDPAREIADNTGLDVTAMHIPKMANYNGELYTHALAELLAGLPPSCVCIALHPRAPTMRRPWQ